MEQGVHVMAFTWMADNNLWVDTALPLMWVLKIKVRLSGLAATAFYSLSHLIYMKKINKKFNMS